MSINYTFPLIERIDQVTPHLDNNFTIKTKDGLIFINYIVASMETFPTVRSYGDAVRRECRGIAFDAKTGKIVSRPFHKFFNLNERTDIEMNRSVWYLYSYTDEKLDGSMIRPLPVAGGVRWGTKAGITDVSMQAEVFLAGKQNYLNFVEYCFEKGLTPIFEYTGPDNRIVLEYKEENVTLLAVRENISGRYLPWDNRLALCTFYKIPEVAAKEYPPLDEIKKSTDIEGVVIHFTDGHMLKVKADWYVKLHKAKELMSNERKLVGMLLNNELDDVMPDLMEDDKKRIEDFEKNLMESLLNVGGTLESLFKIYSSKYDTKRDFAVSATLMDKPWLRSGVFSLWDKRHTTGYEYVLDYLKKNLSTQVKYSAAKAEIGFPSVGEEV